MGWPAAGGDDAPIRRGPKSVVGGDHRRRKSKKNEQNIEVLPQQNPATPVAGERAHRHGKEEGEERKGRRLTSVTDEAFLARNWTA